jgi:hypothetical protein
VRKTVLSLVLSVAALAHPASADTIHVDWSGGGDQTTIWAAVLLASEGDTVLVAPGTYSGVNNTEVNTYGMNLVFTSEGGAAVTIIDGEQEHGAFYITDGQDSTTVVRGFTFANCHHFGGGGAFEISNSSPILEDCVFDGCTTASNGGGVSFFNSGTIIRDCVFRENAAEFRAGAIYTQSSSIRVSRCLFDENETLGSYKGGAIWSNGSEDTYANCTFTENVSDAVRVHYATSFMMTNCIIAGTVGGVAVYQENSSGTEFSHCVVFGNAEGDSLPGYHHDNLFADPLFCDAASDDYTHCADSECLPTVNGWDELVGAYGEGCGPCDTPVEGASWGGIKGLFR